MSETTSATGATGEVRRTGALLFHADCGVGNNKCGVPFSELDVIAFGYRPPTCPDCLAQSRLVQSRQRVNGRPTFRVEVECVHMPAISQLALHRGATLSGALRPDRVYLIHLGIGWNVKISHTRIGVRLDLTDVRKPGGAAMCPDEVWRYACQRFNFDAPWWPAVVACEWGDEAPEVAA